MIGRGGVNDFTVRIATVNGSGSASVNNLLMRAVFRMGVPVSGTNLLPSNIQGLPTWYEIRASRDHRTGRSSRWDLLVAMNAQTYERDIGGLDPETIVLYDSTWPLPRGIMRDDLEFLGIPLAKMCVERFDDARERILLKNIGYAGALVALLAIDPDVVAGLMDETFGADGRLREANREALRLGYQYALDHFDCPLPFHLQTMNETNDAILLNGNYAVALGALYAGAVVGAWYPITPATSVMESFAKLCDRYRHGPEVKSDGHVDAGGNNYLILQAEDELAACGMVLGASWAGARSFVPTSGPGISLMNELLGLAYYTEIPAVVIDVQRAGPSTGMPTRTQQADILECAYASHGDTKHILLFPADPAECFEFTVEAFDLAEHFQTPVMVLSDLDIGMNEWMVPKLRWDDHYRPDRGRVLDAAALDDIPEFFRYSNADADGVAARTFPGVSPKGAYFTRGSGHDRYGRYTEAPGSYSQVVDRLARKHQAAAARVPSSIVVSTVAGARTGVITVGSCDLAVREALELLASQGLPMDYMRVRGFPFDSEVSSFLEAHDTCFVVEQNRDAQLRTLLVLEAGAAPSNLIPVLFYGGEPLIATEVAGAILSEVFRPEPSSAVH